MSMRKDLAHILENWDYNPEDVTVRSILGTDGREKIQMRLDLGLLQIEPTGRPDGKRPHGHESLLEYYEEKLHLHHEFHGDDYGFSLSPAACAELRQESMQYYYRYLSLFHLSRYFEVIRDTERNLRLYNFVHQYATNEENRMVLEQFRPYVLMMRTRARTCISLEEQNYRAAIDEVHEGIQAIEDHWINMERPDQLNQCKEIKFLKDWGNKIEQTRPLSPKEMLKRQLKDAVQREDYERAAEIRDQLKSLVC